MATMSAIAPVAVVPASGQNGPSGETPNTPLADAAVQMAVDSFEDRDRTTRRAVERFMKHHREAAQEEVNENEVLGRIESDEALEAIVKLHRATILAVAAKERAEVATERAAIAAKEAVLAIREYEDVDPDGQWRFDAHRLLILQGNDTGLGKEELRQIVEFAERMANDDAHHDPDSLRAGEFPVDLADVAAKLTGGGIGDFLADLLEFIAENGDTGRRLVQSVCHDIGTALSVAKSGHMPKPVVFLAQLVIKHQMTEGGDEA